MTDKTLKNTIENYTLSDPARFHMPGHKGFLSPYDITELDFSDNLHSPSGVIMELQEKCAKFYSSKHAFISVNGSSCGIVAFQLALARKLSRPPVILCARNCHRSCISGAVVSGSLLIGMNPDSCGRITPEILENAFNDYGGNIDAVIVTSPTYDGTCSPTDKLIEIAHRHNALFFVDFAHGAHFPMSESLPDVPSFDCGVTSLHKTLSALNQSSVLLLNCPICDEIAFAFSVLQTTSPSYPIMCSIEGAISADKYDWDRHINRICEFKKRLCNSGIIVKSEPLSDCDITRLCILSHGIAESGYALGSMLTERGVYVEMSDQDSIICITSPLDKDEWYDRLFDALIMYKNSFSGSDLKINNSIPYPKQLNAACDVRRYSLCEREKVLLRDSVNRIAVSPIGIYPPGVSVMFPGEVITFDAVEFMEMSVKSGGSPFGVEDGLVVVAKE